MRQTTHATDPAIKLFGRNIPLTALHSKPSVFSGKDFSSLEILLEEEEEHKTDKEYSAGEVTDTSLEEEEEEEEEEEDGDDYEVQVQDTEESGDLKTLAGTDVNPEKPSINEEYVKSGNPKADKEQNDGSKTQEKTLKKPSKILPCPRCNSMDTKFCYYNNYNTNQPRHFCKACQRYWTAGGTMRSVPVGAGRRKSKNSASHYRHITISQALQAAHIHAPDGTFNVPAALKTDGRVLCFGLDTPIYDSMASVLNLADKKVPNGARNGFRNFEANGIQIPRKGGDIGGDDCSSRSSVTVLNSMEEGSRICTKDPFVQSINGINGFASLVPCFPGFPWNYSWNSALPTPPPPPSLPTFCPGYPPSFYPPFWNCTMPSGAWNIPWLSPQSSSSSSNQIAPSSPGSPILGKHSRDGDSLKQDDSEKQHSGKHKNGCVLVPKILRVDDPDEAAKSSIWATLGIKNESFNNGGRLFKGLHPKTDEKHHDSEISPVLRANPAALSRSVNFHESA